MADKVLPQKSGFHWARGKGYQYWNLIVQVWGDVPFLKIDIWRYIDGGCEAEVAVDEIEEFGPLLAEEAPEIEGTREDWR